MSSIEDAPKIRIRILLAIILLSVGFTYPLAVHALSSAYDLTKIFPLLQFGVLLITLVTYLTNQLYHSAFQLLNPNSDFEAQGYFELRQQYQITVNHIGKARHLLGLYSITYGGMITILFC